MLVTNVVNNMYNQSLDFNKILGDLLTQPKELTCAEIFNSGTSFLNILLKFKNPMCPKAVWDALIEATKDDERFSTQLAFEHDKRGWLPLHVAVDSTSGKPHTLDIVRDLVRMNPSALISPVLNPPYWENEHLYTFSEKQPYKLPIDLAREQVRGSTEVLDRGSTEVLEYLECETISYLAWRIRRATQLSVCRLMNGKVPAFARKRGGSGMRSKRGYFAYSVITHFLTHGMEPLASEVFSYIGLHQNGPGVTRPSPANGCTEMAAFRQQLKMTSEERRKENEKKKRERIAMKKKKAEERQKTYERKFSEYVRQGKSRAVASDLAREEAGIALTAN
mmetsp:Transcript_31393/g.62234  ORF Transcript_31393/g.62234 Transcript_31393/m.62234 type:complete len:335 (+) Transcript_31393:216-1220(+)